MSNQVQEKKKLHSYIPTAKQRALVVGSALTVFGIAFAVRSARKELPSLGNLADNNEAGAPEGARVLEDA